MVRVGNIGTSSSRGNCDSIAKPCTQNRQGMLHLRRSRRAQRSCSLCCLRSYSPPMKRLGLQIAPARCDQSLQMQADQDTSFSR